MLILSRSPISVCYPVTPSTCLPPLPLHLVHFPDLEGCHALSLSQIIPIPFLSFPLDTFHYSFILFVGVNHMRIILLWLTKFTQHNPIQFHLHRRKCWVFILSNGWVIFHCRHKPYSSFPPIVQYCLLSSEPSWKPENQGASLIYYTGASVSIPKDLQEVEGGSEVKNEK